MQFCAHFSLKWAPIRHKKRNNYKIWVPFTNFPPLQALSIRYFSRFLCSTMMFHRTNSKYKLCYRRWSWTAPDTRRDKKREEKATIMVHQRTNHSSRSDCWKDRNERKRTFIVINQKIIINIIIEILILMKYHIDNCCVVSKWALDARQTAHFWESFYSVEMHAQN